MNEDDERGAKGCWRIEEATGVPFVVMRLRNLSTPGRQTSLQQACSNRIQVYASCARASHSVQSPTRWEIVSQCFV